MHLADGLLDPATCVVTTLASTGALAYALSRERTIDSQHAAPLAATVAAVVFAAQMVNVPLSTSTSGHLLGGVLAAVLLGPWRGLVVIAAVLLVQCLLFGDGGWAAWGANVLNMGVVGCCGGYAILRGVQRLNSGAAGMIAGSGLAAAASVVLASIVAALEIAYGTHTPLLTMLAALVPVHVGIGLGEGLLTALAVAAVWAWRPALLYSSPAQREPSAIDRRTVVGGLGLALLIAVLLAPLASPLPDGLEWSLEQLQIAGVAWPQWLGPLPDYQVPGLTSAAASTALAGTLGLAATFAVTLAALARRPQTPAA